MKEAGSITTKERRTKRICNHHRDAAVFVGVVGRAPIGVTRQMLGALPSTQGWGVTNSDVYGIVYLTRKNFRIKL